MLPAKIRFKKIVLSNWFDNAKFHQTNSFVGQVFTRERDSFGLEGTGLRNPLQSHTISTGHKIETQKKD